MERIFKKVLGPAVWTKENNREILLGGLKGGIIAFAAFYITSMIIGLFDISLANLVLRETVSKTNTIVLIISVLIVGPIFEEILCRRMTFFFLGSCIEKFFNGVLNKENFDYFFLRNAFTISSMLSGFLFITIHQSPVVFWPLYMLISIIFCIQYQKTGSLITPIVAHFIFNMIQLFILLI